MRRGLGVITGPNPANLTQDQLAALTPDQLQMYQSVGWYTPTMSQLTASAFTAQQIAAQNAQEAAAAAPAPVVQAITRQPSTVQPAGPRVTRAFPAACPAWGCGAPAIVGPVSVPTVGPTAIPPLTTAAAPATGFSFSSLPWWVWAGGAAALFFAFGGSHGR